MHGLFLIVRFIFLSLVVFLELLCMIFSAINIGAAKSIGAPVPSAAVLLIVLSCVLFIFIGLGLLELRYESITIAKVKHECAWTVFLGVLQLGAAIDATVNGPADFCFTKGSSAACSSAVLLLPVSWLSTLMLFGYFLLLFISSLQHMREQPEIWSTSVFLVDWFDSGVQQRSSTPRLPPLDAEAQPIGKRQSAGAGSMLTAVLDRFSKVADEDSTASISRVPADTHTVYSARPAWAKEVVTTRGKDTPFVSKNEVLAQYHDGAEDMAGPHPPQRARVQRTSRRSIAPGHVQDRYPRWGALEATTPPVPTLRREYIAEKDPEVDWHVHDSRSMSQWIRADEALGNITTRNGPAKLRYF